MRKKNKNAPGDAWIKHTRSMRESPAWRHLPNNARRVLALFELEHMRQGGARNGSLIVTYTVIVRDGIRRPSISLAIRQAEELGFLEIVRQGGWIANKWQPSRYRLTYLTGIKKSPEPTHEWRAIQSDADAKTALKRARIPGPDLDTKTSPVLDTKTSLSEPEIWARTWIRKRHSILDS